MSNPQQTRKSYFGPGFSQASFERPTAHAKPPKSLLIVTEGQNTEPIYFKSLAAHWSLHPHVVTIEPGGEGIPKNLVDKALAIQSDRLKLDKRGKLAFNQFARFDETWIVFDTEHAARQGQLNDGFKHAKSNGMKIAHSSPCFEFWLCLHYALQARPMNNSKEATSLLEKVARLRAGTYSKAAGPTRNLMEQLILHAANDVRNARILCGQQQGEPFPPNPSTSVHELIVSMHEALPNELKKRFPLP